MHILQLCRDFFVAKPLEEAKFDIESPFAQMDATIQTCFTDCSALAQISDDSADKGPILNESSMVSWSRIMRALLSRRD
jgi:hypothetical protein